MKDLIYNILMFIGSAFVGAGCLGNIKAPVSTTIVQKCECQNCHCIVNCNCK